MAFHFIIHIEMRIRVNYRFLSNSQRRGLQGFVASHCADPGSNVGHIDSDANAYRLAALPERVRRDRQHVPAQAIDDG